ncbi:MAG TPA: EAL domain-containing protein [Steroidobacteraceae bacterium]|nr:EAL domain-containing protein [Steroidobacteraceae bacterium]
MQSALSAASLRRRLDSLRTLRLDARRVINLCIIVLSALVCLLAVRMGLSSLIEYEQAREIEQVDAAADDFTTAAGYRELERTYGSALLGESRPEPEMVRALELAGRQGDEIWKRAMGRARTLAATSTFGADLLARLSSAEASFQALGAARQRLERCIGKQPCALQDTEWQQAVSLALDDSAAARDAAFFGLDTAQRPGRLYGTLKRAAWIVAEYTRRQQGVLAFYLSAGRALTPAARIELASDRAVAGQAQRDLRVFARLHHLDDRVRAAIDRVDRSLSDGFVPLAAAVVSGRRQPDGRAWLAETAPTIAALDHLSATLDEVVAAFADRTMRISRDDMLFNALLVLLACAVAALSVTKVRQTANALFHQKELAEVTIRSIGDAVITTDDLGRVEYINPAAEQMTGWRNSEARGFPLESVFEVVNGLTLERQTNPIEICLRENRVVSLDNNTVLVRRDGARRYIEDSAAPIRDRGGELVGGVLVFYDATEVHQAAHLISYRATHDSLSGLINRREFEHRLAALLARGRDDASEHALLFLDLDRFTVVNESCGHLAGDHLLREVSRILGDHTPAGDVLARLGGDEFGLIVRDCRLDEACALAEALRTAVAGYDFEWQGTHFQPRLSVGLVPFGLDAGAPAALLSRAEAACHLAKEKGRDRLQVYDASDRDIELRSGGMHWIARLNRALTEDRFTLYCQPVVSVSSVGRPHAEVLVRMREPDGRLILASHFIPHAERYGLMPRLDRWVLHEALTYLGALYAQGRGEQAGVLAINLSGATLSDRSLVPFVCEELRAAGVPPQALSFEITETAAVSSLQEASALINSLRRLGCSFALDDFGRGMSSFMYLKQLPVDYLKIDGEFVRNMADDPVSRAMVRAIHALGQAMGIPTVAECVETLTVRRQLEELGVDYVQGLEVGPPEPLARYLQLSADLVG